MTPLDQISNAVGRCATNLHEAVRLIRAQREHCLALAEVVDDFLGIDDWSDESIAPKALIARARKLREAGIASPMPDRRLGVLTQELPKISALLLESIRVTHADVLHFGPISHDKHHGVEIETGEFTHRPTGRRYLISVTAMEITDAA